MKRKIFNFLLFVFSLFLISAVFSFALPKNNYAYAAACISCPDKASLGRGALVNNTGQDPRGCPATNTQCCYYLFSVQGYYFPPKNEPVCATTCDPHTGCTSPTNPGGCDKAGNICTTDDECASSTCTGYHCILGNGYHNPGEGSFPVGSGATCKNVPGAQPLPNNNPNPPGGGNPVNCPSNNCNGVSFPIPALSALGLTMVPNGGSSTLGNIISVTISLLILLAIILCLLYLLWGGFNWITSEGDKTKLESARQKVIYAILGLVVVFCAFLVINLLYQFFLGHLATGIGG